MVEAACGIGPLMMGETLESVAGGIDCYSIRQPLGVCAGICPFNFPVRRRACRPGPAAPRARLAPAP